MSTNPTGNNSNTEYAPYIATLGAVCLGWQVLKCVAGNKINQVFNRNVPAQVVPTEQNPPQIQPKRQHLANLPSAEALVEQIIEFEKTKVEKNDAEWEKTKESYLKFEKNCRENKVPTWGVAGPLHYGMTLEEMKDVVSDTFQEMASKNQLMRNSDFNKKYDRNLYSAESSERLSKLWGAEFLKAKLEKLDSVDVPKHYLIVDDDATEIELQMWHNEYPVLSVVKNSQIVSENIEGKQPDEIPSALSSALQLANYLDHSKPHRFVEDQQKTWVVDTDIDLFAPPNKSPRVHQYQEYLKKRFEVLSGKEYNSLYQTFTISLSDIGL